MYLYIVLESQKQELEKLYEEKLQASLQAKTEEFQKELLEKVITVFFIMCSLHVHVL